MTQPLVSVIVPTLNEAENLRSLLPAIRSQDVDFEFEVIVIDSGSTDATLTVCEESGVRVLEIEKGTFNHGRTRQEAAREARGEILVFTVGDALPVDESWLSRLVAPLRENTGVAGCYGVQLGPDEPLVNPLEKGRSLDEEIAMIVAQGPHARHESDTGRVYKTMAEGHRFEDLPPHEQRQLASFDNCTSCTRRDVLLGSLPFDASTFGEDFQWAAKALQRGYTVVFEPRARVFHYHDQGFGYFFKRMWLDQKVVREVFGLPGHRSLAEVAGSWCKEVGNSWSLLKITSGLSRRARMKWFGYNLKLITANRLARYLTEAEGRPHPMGWIANAVERRLGRHATIRRPG